MNMGPILKIYGAMDRNSRWFEHDIKLGYICTSSITSSPHLIGHVTEYLNEQIPWQMDWPLPSPDFTPVDFDVWRYIKHVAYENKLSRREE